MHTKLVLFFFLFPLAYSLLVLTTVEKARKQNVFLLHQFLLPASTKVRSAAAAATVTAAAAAAGGGGGGAVTATPAA
eukprot:evm.model.NODE_2173_length_12946_cov_34.893711.4